jgi:hypothetical protein
MNRSAEDDGLQLVARIQRPKSNAASFGLGNLAIIA